MKNWRNNTNMHCKPQSLTVGSIFAYARTGTLTLSRDISHILMN